MKKLHYLFLCLALAISSIKAQNCDDVTATATVTPSTCQSNGSITITWSGTSANNLVQKMYSIKSTTGTIAYGPVSNNVFDNLPPGTYNLEAAGFCGSVQGEAIVRTINNVTVTGSYKEPRLTLVAQNYLSNTPALPSSRKSYKNCSTGLIVVLLENGNQATMPTFTMTSAPAGITVPQVVNVTKATSGSATTGWRYLFDGTWPAGNYTISANDGCYNATATFKIDELTTVPTGSTYNIYPHGDGTDCSKFNYLPLYSYTSTNEPDWYRYFNDGLFEYGLAPTGQMPKPESWLPVRNFSGSNSPIYRDLIDMSPGKVSDYYQNSSLTIYTRVKNCPSAIASATTNNYNSASMLNTADNCAGKKVYRFLYGKQSYPHYNTYCYPLTITITDRATGSVKYNNSNHLFTDPDFTWTCNTGDKLYLNVTDASGYKIQTNYFMDGIPATDIPVPSFNSFSDYNANRYCDSYDRPYYSTYPCDNGYPNPVYVTITDNTGTVVQKDTLTSTVIKYARNLKYGVTYTYTFSYPNSGIPDQTLTESIKSTIPVSFTLTKNSTGACGNNKGALRISASAASGRGYMKSGTRITITGPAGYVPQTYMVLTDGSSSSYYYNFVETYLPPGQYTATIVSCGKTDIVKTTVAAGYVADKIGYTLKQDCAGTQLFPSGRILSNGSPLSTVYFRMTSSPTGSGVNNKVIASTNTSDYFLLTTAGTYILGMMTTNSLSGCAIKYDTIYHNPMPLALDRDKTSAYSCPGGSTGYLTLQATNGVLPYTYSVYDKTNTTQLVPPTTSSNALDLGNFGIANETYTVRMSDACGNSFNQQVTLVSLDETALAYGQEVVCYSSPISIFGFTVTNAIYSWTGPNGFTSTLKNPVIPNAKPSDGGWYYVDIHSLACNITVRDSIFIKVYEPVFPNEVNGKTQEITLCPYQALTIGQAATGGSGKYKYQWQYSNNDGVSWYNVTNITGTNPILTTTSTSYIFTSTTSNPTYRHLRLMVDDEDCGKYYLYYHTNVKGCMFLVNPELKTPGSEN